MTYEKHHCLEQNASQILDWLKTRGGLALWKSVDLSDPAKHWTTPLNDASGKPATKPTWQAANEPYRVITDPSEVLVDTPVEITRFRIHTRMGAQGLRVKLTDHSSAKLRAALERAGTGSWYEFDYETQEAVIYKADKAISLTEWELQHVTNAQAQETK